MKDEWTFMSQLPQTVGRYVVFDTETTGLVPKSDHILEIAAIEVVNGALTGNQFHVYIKPRTRIRKEATEINKMDNEFYKKNYDKVYENEKQLLTNFLNFVNGSIIFTHNAVFDYNFISKELEYHNLPLIPKNNFRCTMRIYKKFTSQNKLMSYSLEKCAESFEIEIDKNRLHSGIYDTEITAKMLIRIFEKYNMKENTHVSSNKSLESCLRNLNDGDDKKSLTSSPTKSNPTARTNTLSLNTNTLPSERDKAARDLKLGLLTTMEDTNNISAQNMNEDFLSQKELSVCITDFDNLSLVYTDSKATTNTLNPRVQETNTYNPGSIQTKYDDKIKALTDLNRTYVNNTMNNNTVNTSNINNRSVQQIHDNNRKEFEKKIDRNTLRDHFQNLNK
jgi:DNA polymerase-3 subunit epsilon